MIYGDGWDDDCDDWYGDCRGGEDRDRRGRRSGRDRRDGRYDRDEGEAWRDRFDDLDRNGDGYISRREWTGDRQRFLDFDRNDDRLLSPPEFRQEFRAADRRRGRRGGR